MDFSYFTADGETLTPTDLASSLWDDQQIHGVATSGAMARAIERSVDRPDLRPARYTLDMFRAASTKPFTVETRVVRESKRILLVDAVLRQDGEDMVRAGCVWLKATENPEGEVWASEDQPVPPPLDLAPIATGPTIPWFRSSQGWSQDFADHQNSGRKQTWQHGLPIVAGEEATPFQTVASMADATTMAVNWGTRGVEYINTDITLSLSRLPRTFELGLQATSWSSHDGIATGVATMYDREGIVGHSMITSLSNSRRAIDFTAHSYDETDGTRTSRV